ncbi:MAG: response regulator [Candidatus Margulisbacteria bacterium]|nr:response regulator [Candidatus Margulisiibacteriota bacterium]
MDKSKYIILIVEDDSGTRMLLRDRLRHEGFTIETASNGIEGLDKAIKLKPDIVILDVMMPGKNGYVVCSELRKNPKTKEMFIIMFTAKSMMKDMEVGYNAGADYYVPKPFEMDDLLKKIKMCLNKKMLDKIFDDKN